MFVESTVSPTGLRKEMGTQSTRADADVPGPG